MRTTINIDDPILKGLKRLQNREGKPLGRLVSDLLAQALATRGRSFPPRRGSDGSRSRCVRASIWPTNTLCSMRWTSRTLNIAAGSARRKIVSNCSQTHRCDDPGNLLVFRYFLYFLGQGEATRAHACSGA
jgi:hypothetical protein